jgi:predicted oxidoreductase
VFDAWIFLESSISQLWRPSKTSSPIPSWITALQDPIELPWCPEFNSEVGTLSPIQSREHKLSWIILRSDITASTNDVNDDRKHGELSIRTDESRGELSMRVDESCGKS